MSNTDFSGKDLIVRFDEDQRNTGVKGYRLRYVLKSGEIIHDVAQESYQLEDTDGIRSYYDTLTYEENVSKGKTRNVDIYMSTWFASGLRSGEAKIQVKNPAPALPAVNYGLGDTFLTINLTVPDDTDFAGFLVWASEAPNQTYGQVNENYRMMGPGPSFTLAGLTPDTRYYIGYAAYDAFGIDELNTGYVELSTLSQDSNVLPLIEAQIEELSDGIGDLIIHYATANDKVARAFHDDAIAVTNTLNQKIDDQGVNFAEQINGISSSFQDQLEDTENALENKINAAVQNESTVTTSKLEALAKTVELMGADVNGNRAAIVAESQTRAKADEAAANSRQELQASFGGLDGKLNSLTGDVRKTEASIVAIQDVIANSDSASTTFVQQQLSKFNQDNATNLANGLSDTKLEVTALIQTTQKTLADATKAVADRVEVVNATYDNGLRQMEARISSVSQTLADSTGALSRQIDAVKASIGPDYDDSSIQAAIVQLREAQVNGDRAIATDVSQIKARLDNNNGASIEQRFEAIANLNGAITAAWTIKTEVLQNGRRVVGGVGLFNDGNSTEFAVKADRFIVTDGSGNSNGFPFEVIGGRTRIRDAYIGNANIDNATLAGEKLVPNAVSMFNDFKYLPGFDTNYGMSSGSYPFMSAVVSAPNVPAGTKVRIDLACECSGGSDGKAGYFKLVRNDGYQTNEVRMTVPDEGSGIQNWFWTDTIPGDGTWSYTLYARYDSSKFRYRNIALAGLIQKR